MNWHQARSWFLDGFYASSDDFNGTTFLFPTDQHYRDQLNEAFNKAWQQYISEERNGIDETR